MIGQSFFSEDSITVAPRLLGKELVCGDCRGIIVETEAYAQDDPASHSCRGQTKRNAPMFLGGGHAYVYLIYGVHLCFNIVTGPPGCGQAVLIRACHPSAAIATMWKNRYGEPMPKKPAQRNLHNLTSGPGKLCAAFGIDMLKHNGQKLCSPSLHLCEGKSSPDQIIRTARIGMPKGKGDLTPWRWYIKGDPFVSRT